MKVEIVKFDNLGRGLGYTNNKIIFIPKSVPRDIVEVVITKEKKDYLEGQIKNIIKPSRIRINPICPYFNYCGGCDLQHISLSESLEYKLQKINNLLKQNKIDFEVKDILKSEEQFHYRNKVSFKIEQGQVGFYKNDSHDLIKIDYCYLIPDIVNKLIKDIVILGISDGIITIKINYNQDLLIIIDSINEIENVEKIINTYKVAGIIQNKKIIYGEEYFIHKINNYLFRVSYDSFFQINPFICAKLFDLIVKYTSDSQNILDLYCGVGTLSIVASTNGASVLGVEIVPNAIKDANFNKMINNAQNVEFICSDTKNILKKITNNFDMVILDPPRSGVIKSVISKIIDSQIKKIIYVSCNPATLIRDLKLLLLNYSIENLILLDMFPNSEHVECVCVLNLR